MWNWMSAAGSPDRVRTNAHDLGDGRGERARAAQHPLGEVPRAFGVRERAGVRDSQMRSRTGGPAGCGRRPAGRGAAATPTARSSSGGPIPHSSRSWGEWIAPAERITSRAARSVRRTLRRSATRTPTARPSSQLDAVHEAPVRTSRFGPPQRRAQVGVGRAEARAVALRDLEHARCRPAPGRCSRRCTGSPRPGSAVSRRATERTRRSLLGDVERSARAVELGGAAGVVLRAQEVGEDVVLAPAGRALLRPQVVVERPAAHVEHRVHRARAAEPFPRGM